MVYLQNIPEILRGMIQIEVLCVHFANFLLIFICTLSGLNGRLTEGVLIAQSCNSPIKHPKLSEIKAMKITAQAPMSNPQLPVPHLSSPTTHSAAISALGGRPIVTSSLFRMKARPTWGKSGLRREALRGQRGSGMGPCGKRAAIRVRLSRQQTRMKLLCSDC